MIPPVSPHNETMNTGVVKVILSLLVLYGLLESNGSTADNEDADIKQLRLAPNASKRYLLMVSDGLTQMRAKQFNKLIEETSHSFGPRYKVTVMLQKAMDQVNFIPGDLHGGGFHIMQVVYNLFYGAFIQKIQAVLKWKRICGSDVSKCYQQATSLASIFATELEHGVLAEYIKIVHHSADRRRAFQQICNAKKLAIHLAEGYRKWIEEHRKDTTNEVFRLTLNFISVMNIYRMFRVAIRCGDAVMIEWIYREILPLFNITNKKHYFEIGLNRLKIFTVRFQPSFCI